VHDEHGEIQLLQTPLIGVALGSTHDVQAVADVHDEQVSGHLLQPLLPSLNEPGPHEATQFDPTKKKPYLQAEHCVTVLWQPLHPSAHGRQFPFTFKVLAGQAVTQAPLLETPIWHEVHLSASFSQVLHLLLHLRQFPLTA
jgi:hypothetical protein